MKTALIIGATGGIGSETARALLGRGWRVRALTRDLERARRAEPDLGVEWVAGDAMNTADVVAAARGVSVVVHAANPPGYRNWRGLALPMLESSIAAAISRRRPKRIEASFPTTLINVPSRPSTVTTTVGDRSSPFSPVLTATKARNATPQPRNAFISSVCTQ